MLDNSNPISFSMKQLIDRHVTMDATVISVGIVDKSKDPHSDTDMEGEPQGNFPERQDRLLYEMQTWRSLFLSLRQEKPQVRLTGPLRISLAKPVWSAPPQFMLQECPGQWHGTNSKQGKVNDCGHMVTNKDFKVLWVSRHPTYDNAAVCSHEHTIVENFLNFFVMVKEFCQEDRSTQFTTYNVY